MFNSRMPRISGLKWRALVILAGTRALLVCNKTWVKPKPEILHPNGDPQKWSFGLVIIKENPPADRDPKYPKTAADGSVTADLGCLLQFYCFHFYIGHPLLQEILPGR